MVNRQIKYTKGKGGMRFKKERDRPNFKSKQQFSKISNHNKFVNVKTNVKSKFEVKKDIGLTAKRHQEEDNLSDDNEEPNAFEQLLSCFSNSSNKASTVSDDDTNSDCEEEVSDEDIAMETSTLENIDVKKESYTYNSSKCLKTELCDALSINIDDLANVKVN